VRLGFELERDINEGNRFVNFLQGLLSTLPGRSVRGDSGAPKPQKQSALDLHTQAAAAACVGGGGRAQPTKMEGEEGAPQ
jgi:hypothetical protein